MRRCRICRSIKARRTTIERLEKTVGGTKSRFCRWPRITASQSTATPPITTKTRSTLLQTKAPSVSVHGDLKLQPVDSTTSKEDPSLAWYQYVSSNVAFAQLQLYELQLFANRLQFTIDSGSFKPNCITDRRHDSSKPQIKFSWRPHACAKWDVELIECSELIEWWLGSRRCGSSALANHLDFELAQEPGTKVRVFEEAHSHSSTNSSSTACILSFLPVACPYSFISSCRDQAYINRSLLTVNVSFTQDASVHRSPRPPLGSSRNGANMCVSCAGSDVNHDCVHDCPSCHHSRNPEPLSCRSSFVGRI